jgi:hypothetical protein
VANFVKAKGKYNAGNVLVDQWEQTVFKLFSPKSSGIFRRQPENSAARACIDHKSLSNSMQPHRYSQGFVIDVG